MFSASVDQKTTLNINNTIYLLGHCSKSLSEKDLRIHGMSATCLYKQIGLWKNKSKKIDLNKICSEFILEKYPEKVFKHNIQSSTKILLGLKRESLSRLRRFFYQ